MIKIKHLNKFYRTKQILNKVKEKNNITILLTSHFLDEIENLADQLIILEKGEVKSIGTVRSFIEQEFGLFEKIACTIDDEDMLKSLKQEQIGVMKLEKDNYLLSVESEKVQGVMKKLYENNVKDIKHSSYTFEDAFMNRFGYTMNMEGETE